MAGATAAPGIGVLLQHGARRLAVVAKAPRMRPRPRPAAREGRLRRRQGLALELRHLDPLRSLGEHDGHAAAPA